MDTQRKSLLLTVIGVALLIDVAIETFIGGSPLRWWIALPAICLVALVVALWRPGGRPAREWGWQGAAVLSVGGLFVLVAASAWFPGGLQEGVRLLRQPTGAVLAGLTICALAASAWIALRAQWMPLWLRLVPAALAVYAAAALALGFVHATPYPALFHGAGFWGSLPARLQGPTVGVFVVLPLGVLLAAISWRRARGQASPGRVSLAPVALVAAAFAAGLAAILAVGGTPGGSYFSTGAGAAAGSVAPGVDFPWRSEVVTPAANDEERRAATEQAASQYQQIKTAAAEMRANPISLDEALEKIGRDPATLNQWIAQRVAFEPYEGFMKGPEGTLVSRRANAADKAWLLAELLKRAGMSVQIVHGTLPGEKQPKAGLPDDPGRPTETQLADMGKRLGLEAGELRTALATVQTRQEKLLENLWTRSDRDTTAVAAALTAARVRVPAEVTWPVDTEHWWVRTDKGDFDPTLGQLGGTETGTYGLDELPAERFHTLAIRMRVASGGKEKTFLDKSFRTADVFGRTIAVANAPVGFPKKLQGGGKFTADAIFSAAGAATEFQPQMIVGGKRMKGDTFDLRGNKVSAKGGQSDQTGGLGGGLGGMFGGLSGSEGEEEKPAPGKMTLTAVYLEVELGGPSAGATPMRIRRNLLGPKSAGRQRVLDLLTVRELLVMPDEVTPDFVNNALLEYADAWRKWIGEHRYSDYSPLKISDSQDRPHFDPTLYAFGMMRRSQLRRLSETRLGGGQWVHPRPTLVSNVMRLVDGQRPTMMAGIDILSNALLPLQKGGGDWRRQLPFVVGVLDTALEHEVNAGPGVHSNTSVFLEQSLMKGQQPVALESLPANVRVSDQARAEIQDHLASAVVVLVPQEPASWYRVDLATGAALGYVEGGGGQEMAEYGELIAMDIEMYSTMEFWGNLFKCIAMGVSAPLANADNRLESLEECFKLICGAVPGVVGKLAEAEGLIASVLGFAVDKWYGKLCDRIWNTMTGKGGAGAK